MGELRHARISHGGYQIGLAFYKAILQDFGPATSATVVRDRLIGVFFGLIVFGIVEHLLWPVRARDALRARLAELMHLLADLARSATTREKRLQSSILDHQSSAAVSMATNDVDSWRRRISQKVEDIQGLIESSKFESGDLELDEIQKRTGDGQLVFVLLLSLARQSREISQSDVVRTTANELDNVIATGLEGLAMRAAGGPETPVPALEDALNAFERSTAGMDAFDKEAAAHFAGRLALYRALVAAIKRLCSELLNTDRYRSLASNGSVL